jgi:murein DD-endopeptidase MepM/ murein hydrolase activator NlpD
MEKYKIIIPVLCLALVTSLYTVDISASKQTDYSSAEDSIADTIDNLESEKSNNSDKIAELQQEIENAQKILEQSKDDEQAKLNYQNALEEKMNLQQENILYIEKQISALESNIQTHQQNISVLESEIQQKQQEVDDGIEDFKSRLRAMYISGNASYASILTGSTSFYDLLSRIELINRISKRDDEIINSLQQQLVSLNEDKLTLETENQTLNEQIEESAKIKAEYTATLESLSEDYQNTQSEIERIALEQQEIELQQSEKSEQVRIMEEEQKAIEDEIIKAQAEIKRIQEEKAAEEERIRQEEEKKKKEEEEKKKEEEEKKKQEEEKKKQEETVVTTAPSASSWSTDTSSSYTGGTMTWPVPGHYIITDYYGTRTWDGSGFHYGLDIGGGNIGGSSIVAAESGTVILAINYCTHNYAKYSSCGCGGGFGNYVVIDHGGTYATLYGHCESINVSVGDYVTKGQTIGKVGTTGYSTGYHLHFEVRENGQRINPLDFLSY